MSIIDDFSGNTPNDELLMIYALSANNRDEKLDRILSNYETRSSISQLRMYFISFVRSLSAEFAELGGREKWANVFFLDQYYELNDADCISLFILIIAIRSFLHDGTHDSYPEFHRCFNPTVYKAWTTSIIGDKTAVNQFMERITNQNIVDLIDNMIKTLDQHVSHKNVMRGIKNVSKRVANQRYLTRVLRGNPRAHNATRRNPLQAMNSGILRKIAQAVH
jgi:hypothetical protein